MTHLLRDEYRIRQVTKVTADTFEALVDKLDGVDRAGFLNEIDAYNAAVRTDIAFDPTVKDGRNTQGLAVPKSNWANPLDKPPYEAYGVGCGITFTFGGVRIDTGGQVIDTDGLPTPGLYAAGGNGRRALLFQLPRRNRAYIGRRVRSHRRQLGRGAAVGNR